MSEMFLIYCKRKTGLRRKSDHIVLLGPIVPTKEEAESIVADRNAKGWNASWVGLNNQATWIVQ